MSEQKSTNRKVFPVQFQANQMLRNDSSLKDRAKETGKGEQIKGRNW